MKVRGVRDVVFGAVFVVILASIGTNGYYRPEPCPIGCRCTAGPEMHGRHRWHRLLAHQRMRRLVFGHGQAGDGRLRRPTEEQPGGREMTCLGLGSMPNQIPTDLTKITIYGDMQGIMGKDGSQRGAPVQPRRDSRTVHQITSIGKYAFWRARAVKELTIEGNKITTIKSNDFEMLRKLKKLNLRRNRLKQITLNGLAGLNLLEELDISENHLQELRSDLFNDVPKLKKLILNKNNIKNLNTKLFATLRNLQYIDLSDNYFKDLPKDIFYTNHKLQEIIIENNNIELLRPEWFSGLMSLTKLSMKGNKISQISHTTMYSLPNLQSLSLAKNQLVIVRSMAFMRMTKLRNLDLSNNKISQIEKGAFTGLGGLHELDLGGNKLRKFDNNSFIDLVSLKVLSLHKNNIRELLPDGLKSMKTLQRLDLSHNELTNIQKRTFYGLLDLRELKLDFNEIRSIDDEAFAVSILNTFSKVTWLYLNGNKLRMVNKDMLYGLPYVKFLNLGHNKIDTIKDGALKTLQRLNTLMLNHNKLVDLASGTFEMLKHLNHLNLAENDIRGIQINVLAGLKNLEDVNLEGNEISEISVDAFADTPNLIGLNMRRNMIKRFDLGMLDTNRRMKHIDLSRNKISILRLPRTEPRTLFSLSLAENILQTISEKVTKCLSPGGALHLYGNPWSCDCEISWIKKVSQYGPVQVTDGNDIVCRTPSYLRGQKLLSIHSSQFVCTGGRNGRREPLQMATAMSCDFTAYALQNNKRRDIKSRKREVLDWYAAIHDNRHRVFCTGVAIAENWVLTTSGCWKNHDSRLWAKSRVTFGATQRLTQKVRNIQQVLHYPGRMDFALVKLTTPKDPSTLIRHFPCLLSSTSTRDAAKKKIHGIMTARAIYRKQRSKVKIGAFPFKAKRERECSGLCIKGHIKQMKDGYFFTESSPYFVRVGRGKWALAGMNSQHGRTNNLQVMPVHRIARWVESKLK